jgi:presenilin-like A22 family membrane protease
MKHPIKETTKTVLWLIGMVLVGIYAVGNVLKVTPPSDFIDPKVYAIVLISAIGIGAVFWTIVMKKLKPENVDHVFALAVGAITGRALFILIPQLNAIGMWPAFIAKLIITVVSYFAFLRLVRTMQKSWPHAQKYAWVSTLWVNVAIATAATMIAVDVAPWVAIVVLFVIAIYDAWAVWKSKTMIKMAQYFMKRRIFPGIAVPYKDKQKFALLGGGDVFFIVFVATSFFRNDPLTTYVTAATMTVATALLFLVSSKDRFYPALPFIFAGLLVGLLIRFFLWTVVFI